jgi:hypothetical protein
VHEHVDREPAVGWHQRRFRLEGDHLAVGADRRVDAAEAESALGAAGGDADPDRGVQRAVVDEDVEVDVAV